MIWDVDLQRPDKGPRANNLEARLLVRANRACVVCAHREIDVAAAAVRQNVEYLSQHLSGNSPTAVGLRHGEVIDERVDAADSVFELIAPLDT